MKHYLGELLYILFALLLIFNIFLVIKYNNEISESKADAITEFCICVDETKESLQYLIESEDPAYQNNMMYVLHGEFSTLYHLCHSSRYLDDFAGSDFNRIGVTFIGNASPRHFNTIGIYEDSKITENEYAYLKELITLLDKVTEGLTGTNSKDDLNILNANMETMNEHLADKENSPYRLIAVQE